MLVATADGWNGAEVEHEFVGCLVRLEIPTGFGLPYTRGLGGWHYAPGQSP
jgi:hypothetical protein